MLYNVYSDYLKAKYGEKVYKLPINLPATCPNRDGTLGTGGCIYCGEKGVGYESLSSDLSVSNQIRKNREYIGGKYNAKKFIAYFQNFSNTYLPFSDFKKYITEAAEEDVVEIGISTRPDCVAEDHLVFLKEIKEKYNIETTLELGLQTVNYKTLKILNRGHDLAQFIDCVNAAKKYGLRICAHMIPDLPWDDREDVAEGAKILSALKVDGVKLHSLYVVKNTPLEKMYLSGEVKLLGAGEYADRCVLFLRHLSPEIVVERIIGRVPEADCVIANDNTSWWKIRDMIEEKMNKNSFRQGDLFCYLDGSAKYR